MPDNIYTFFQSENEDGVDYLFFSNRGRLYTVSFDTSVYAGYVDQFPTLLKHGYGIIFSFTQAIRVSATTSKGAESPFDEMVWSTIAEITSDFLKNGNDSTFIVYQCPGFKEQKLFSNWFEKCEHCKKVVKEGVTISIDKDPNSNEYFGFIALKSNPYIKSATDELQEFSISLTVEHESQNMPIAENRKTED